jgi:dATP pyrophosphohydrolase
MKKNSNNVYIKSKIDVNENGSGENSITTYENVSFAEKQLSSDDANDSIGESNNDGFKIKKSINDEILKGKILELKSAVAIIVRKDKVLLGLANCDDERHNKWCFVGGTIEQGEDCISAAIREAYEESGLICKAINSIVMIHPAKPNVGFVLLESENEEIKINEEFFEARWFSLYDLPYNILPLNLEILKNQFEIKTVDMPDNIEKSIHDELNKRRDHILKGFSDLSPEYLEKGGEGSRGGSVIGHTKSGKPIYENRNAKGEKDYDSQDHEDAAYGHLDHNEKKKGKRNTHHVDEFERHSATSRYKKQTEDVVNRK